MCVGVYVEIYASIYSECSFGDRDTVGGHGFENSKIS
jgi:hypothetical protein